MASAPAAMSSRAPSAAAPSGCVHRAARCSGVQPPRSSLGLLIQEGGSYMLQAPWLLFAPAAVLVVAILSINLIGDTMRDRLDPRETRSLV